MMKAALWRRNRVFLGEYSHSLDGKGRVVMPSKFRPELAAGCVVTKGQERCIYVFPMDRWEEESRMVLDLPRTDRRARDLARSFFASASDQTPDRQGRVQIPEPLRKYAGLEKDLVVVGVADHIEIWAAETWESVVAEADDYYAGIQEAVSEHGI
jgi:MraZ protein